jgi:uncharacterized membrane protein YfcA
MRASIALTAVNILGASFASFIFNMSKRNNHRGHPLIDWDLIAVMEPCTVLGAVAGGYLNKVSHFL